MFHSMQKERSKKQTLLNKNDLSGLNEQQRQFAQQQFRIIYAQEMSKLSLQMSHNKRVQENLKSLDQQEQKNLKQQQVKLKTKMAVIEQKRNKKLEEKMKHYKQNDQRWFHKLKQIQQRFKQQNRDAIDKAKKYRQESQNYWKNKEKRLNDNSRAQMNMSRRQRNGVHKSLGQSGLFQSRFENPFNKRNTINHQMLNRSAKTAHAHSNQELDQQIQLHKQKSQNIQKQKEGYIFQKALQKMARIQKKRQQKQKKMEGKKAEPTEPKKVDSHRRQNYKKSNHRQQSLNNQNAHGLKKQGSKQSLDRIIKDHIQTKQRLEQEQFMHRGQIIQNSNQRARKEKIMKMIRNRVHQMKVNTMIKQNKQ